MLAAGVKLGSLVSGFGYPGKEATSRVASFPLSRDNCCEREFLRTTETHAWVAVYDAGARTIHLAIAARADMRHGASASNAQTNDQ